MSKTVLIVGGVIAAGAVAYFVVSVATKPKASGVPRGTAPQSSNTAFVGGIINGIVGIVSSVNRKAPTPNNAPLTNIGVPSYGSTAYDTNPNYNSDLGDYGPYLPNPNEATAGEGPLFGPGF